MRSHCQDAVKVGDEIYCGFTPCRAIQHCPQGFDDEDYDDDNFECETCCGAGFILICPDDICNGMGRCIHGDGEIPCPECGG